MEDNLQIIESIELVQTLDKLVSKESTTTLDILIYLNELERRKLYLELGYNSLWSYMTLKLKYSEPGASRRVTAARCIREFPEVYKLLESRALSLSALCIVSGILNNENKEDILTRVVGKSFKDVEKIVATYKPKGEVRDTLKPISVSLPEMPKEATPPLVYPAKQEFVQSHSIESAPSKIVMEKVKITFQASTDFSKKFERVRSLLSGKYPRGGTFEEVFDEALEIYLKVHDPEKRAERRARRGAFKEFTGREGKRAASKPLQDLVLVRDKCCSYVSPEGIRCNSTWDLEVHHITPWGHGGTTSTENLTVLCRAHNMHQAERDFGKGYMSKFRVA